MGDFFPPAAACSLCSLDRSLYHTASQEAVGSNSNLWSSLTSMSSKEMVIKATCLAREGSDNIGEEKIKCFSDEFRLHIPSAPEHV